MSLLTKQNLIDWWKSKDNEIADFNDKKDFWLFLSKFGGFQVFSSVYTNKHNSLTDLVKIKTCRSKYYVELHFLSETGECFLLRY